MKTYLRILAMLILAFVLVAEDAFSQRRGGGGRGGGGGFSSRGGARASVSRPSVSRGRPSQPIANRPGRDLGDRNVGVNRGRDVNRERTVTRDREVNVNRGGDYGWYDGCCNHPVAAAAVVGTAAAVGAAYGAAAYGTTYYSLPGYCTTSVYNGITYSNCDGTWYQPQFSGSETTYVVVQAPDD